MDDDVDVGLVAFDDASEEGLLRAGHVRNGLHERAHLRVVGIDVLHATVAAVDEVGRVGAFGPPSPELIVGEVDVEPTVLEYEVVEAEQACEGEEANADDAPAPVAVVHRRFGRHCHILAQPD